MGDSAFVVVHRLDNALVGAGDNLFPFFRVELFRQGGRTDDIGEQYRHWLAHALVLQGSLLNFFFQIWRGSLAQGSELVCLRDG